MPAPRCIAYKMFKLLYKSIVFLALVSGATGAAALEEPKTELDGVGIYTELGSTVDFTLPFVDSDGNTTTLGQISEGKPLILVPAYYDCPRLCGLVLKGTLKLINSLTLQLGSDYKVVVVSFDPLEGPELAAKTASQYYSELIKQPKQGAGAVFKFLTGSKASIDALLGQLKFKMVKDRDEYAHTSAIMILTPQGKISQYLSGIEFSSFDTRLALVEASHGSIGNPLDHAFLFCFRFDPKKGKYTWAAFNLMRVGALLTLASLVLLVVKLLRSPRVSP